MDSVYRALQSALLSTENRGSVHVFLGDPRSDGGDKTTVEPGNAFSPGVWTCGVALWGFSGGEWRGVEQLPADALTWGFGDSTGPTGRPPVLSASYRLGSLTVRHLLGHCRGEASAGTDANEVEIDAPEGGSIGVVIRGIGPAGGRISAITETASDPYASVLTVDGNVDVGFDQLPSHVYVSADDSPLWAIARFDLSASPRPHAIRFVCHHRFAGFPFGDSVPDTLGADSHRKEELTINAIRDHWADEIPTRISCPDDRVIAGWEQSAFHILSAMERGLPRIGAVNYPGFWMRDGVIVLRALDLVGRTDLARVGADYLAPLYHSGGFGAESDGPGEGIWALVRHYGITQDTEWLRRVYPHIAARARLIESMRTAENPMFAVAENRSPRYVDNPWINLLCLRSKDGLIQGRMDWHAPNYYINCWAYAGLYEASRAASLLLQTDEAAAWSTSAADLQNRIGEHLLPQFGNDRDPAVAPYPTGAFAAQPSRVMSKLEPWYRTHRLDANGESIPEPLWTYFEVAQAHNAMLLGMVDEAWITMNRLFSRQSAWDVSAFGEGPPGGTEYLPFGNHTQSLGWLRADAATHGNMPHNWTTAEVVNFLRDVFVREEDDHLVLGAGVPASWLLPGTSFGIRNAQTELGLCTYEVTTLGGGQRTLVYTGTAPIRTPFECTVQRR